MAGRVVLVSVLTSHALTGAPRAKDVRKPEMPPPGEWRVERWETDGRLVEFKTGSATEKIVRFSSSKWTLSYKEASVPIMEWAAAYYQVEAVHEVDFNSDEPKQFRKGIWKLDGDVLLICYSRPGADRPTDFTAPKGSSRTLYTLRRREKE
jgi:uncharacterized protein (TIGR03067 family)